MDNQKISPKAKKMPSKEIQKGLRQFGSFHDLKKMLPFENSNDFLDSGEKAYGKKSV